MGACIGSTQLFKPENEGESLFDWKIKEGLEKRLEYMKYKDRDNCSVDKLYSIYPEGNINFGKELIDAIPEKLRSFCSWHLNNQGDW